jgi:transposase
VAERRPGEHSALAAQDRRARWLKVRALSLQGMSQRKIAKQLEINRRTVAKLLSAETPPRQPARRKGSRLDPLVSVIGRLLAEQPQMKAPQLTELLRAKYGYDGSVDLVRRRLAQLRATQPSRARQRDAGRVLEWEWVELKARLWIDGARRRVWALVAYLPFSDTEVAHFSLDASLQSFLEAHVRVFTWLGGVPVECSYAHLPPAVARRDRRQALRWSKRFRELRRHYAFRTSVRAQCEGPAPEKYPPAAEADDVELPAAGAAASTVEQLGSSLKPALHLQEPGELDVLYATWRAKLARSSPEGQAARAAARRLAQERKALNQLPADEFDFSLVRSIRVPPDGYVRYGASFYRAPVYLARECVELHASRNEVWLVARGQRVVAYPRSYRPGQWLPDRERCTFLS